LYGDEIEAALISAIDEIHPRDYGGQYPPELAHEDDIDGAEMFVFKWVSASRECRMYIKFCRFNDTLNLISFHKQRREPK
jgi:hypothetical protein